MRKVTEETVKAEIERMESFSSCTTRSLSIVEEFHLSCLKKLLEVMAPAPEVKPNVVYELDKKGRDKIRDELITAMIEEGMKDTIATNKPMVRFGDYKPEFIKKGF